MVMADMPQRRIIPGFVFDEARGRYFPVLPGHKAPPNYSYTEDAVKKQDELREKKKRDEDRASRTSLRSRREERYLNNPGLGRFMLETGWGTHRDQMEIFTRQFASSLEVGEILQLEGGYKIQKFCWDYETGQIITGAQGTSNIGLWPFDTSKFGESRMGRVSSHDITPLYLSASEITSVNIGVTRTLVSTSLGDKDGAVINLSKLVCRDAYMVDKLLQTGCQVILCPNNHQSVWTSAVSKVDGTVAAGTSKGIIIIKEEQCHWGDQALDLPSDVFALEFLKPELLACGGRDSALRLVDTRMSTAHANSNSSITVRHPSSITHIKQINENDVIVCGLEDSLCMYDLRWGHLKSPSKGFEMPSQPILEFVEHKNKFRLGLGFDVNVEHGIAAAATDDNRVQLFSLHTARKIRSQVSKEPFAGLVKCIQFAGVDSGKDRSPSLLASAENTFHVFSW